MLWSASSFSILIRFLGGCEERLLGVVVVNVSLGVVWLLTDADAAGDCSALMEVIGNDHDTTPGGRNRRFNPVRCKMGA